MNHTFGVPCPNCGSWATRSYFNSSEAKYSNCPQNHVIQTECSHCDYLMIMCSFNGNVIEAHASSTSAMMKENQKQLMLLPAKLLT
ncbi:MAG: hypothetical protein AAF298_11330 [Cyanobacteria bacterium P01_A01_bin.40]